MALQRITAEHVSFRGRGAPSPRWLLEDLSFSLPAGDLLTVVGPSGSGKTTLLRILAHLENPTQGRVLLDGIPLDVIPLADLRSRLGMVAQVPALFEGTVADNLLFGPRIRAEGDPAGAREMLGRVGLRESLFEERADRLSVGEQQRVALARALVLEPEVLLIDEPTSALDPASTARIFRLIQGLNRETGLTVIQVTHAVELARGMSGRILLLVDGKKVEEGPSAEFFAGPKTQTGRAFVDGRLE